MNLTRRTTVLVAVAGLALAACSGGDAPTPAASAPTTSTTSPSASTVTTGSGSSTSTSSASPGAGCANAEGALPPAGASDVSEADVDVDGDGTPDRVLTYRQADGSRRVAVELAAGGTAAVDASRSEIDGPSPLSLLGGVDLGGDGRTVLAVTGGGASVVVVGLFQFVECAITQVVLASGQPAEFPVGAAVTHADGLACRGETLLSRSASSTDGETFTTTETRYQVDGNTLIELDTETGTLTRARDNATIDGFATVDCVGLEPL